jgi:hypothetical protein
MKLITEISHDIESLIENTSSGRKYSIEGRFATGDEKNANGRIYESSVLHPAMKRYVNEKVNLGRGFGEMNHPQSPQVNFERVVMVIESMNPDGSHWNGKANIINEGLGKIVTAIMEAGGRVGVSTRALGTLREGNNGVKYVNNDLMFSAVDVVSDPSGPGCFIKGIMESVSYEMLEDGSVIQLAVEATKKKITEEKALKAFASLMLKFGNK